MKRKNFLLTTAAAIPALLIAPNTQAQKAKRPNKGFVVKATESRFNEKTLIGGKSANDIKVSFRVGEEEHHLKAGDTIFLPRTLPHAFAQLSEYGKMFFLFQPSGYR